jgi:lipooligosaccharide transport system permease protein
VIYLGIMAAFGTVHSGLALLAVPTAVVSGLAFATPIAAFAATQKNDTGFATLYRFGLIPLFLFSGTFFPISQLPGWLQALARATPLLPRGGALPGARARPRAGVARAQASLTERF